MLSVEGICHGIDWTSIPAIVCATFYDAKSAIEYIDQNSVDIVITDIRMPGMTGLDLMSPHLTRKNFLKIIFISAYDDFYYVQALRIGAFDLYRKTHFVELLFRNFKERRPIKVIEQDK